MKQRLQTLLFTEKLASSKFADIVGVNRSSISHLLSGRNNPGLDFLQKVLVKFPHINPDWLMLGQGSMYRNSKPEKPDLPKNPVLFEEKTTNKEPEVIKSSPAQVEKAPQPAPVTEPEEIAVYPGPEEPEDEDMEPSNSVAEGKKLERIVYFYTDGTFDTYTPNGRL